MRIRGAGSRKDDKIELNMTPMIDIVFQLLIFFIMSMRIAAAEGDFSVKMPLVASHAAAPSERELSPLYLRMTANADGSLASLELDRETLADNIDGPAGAERAFETLHRRVIEHVGDARGPGSIAAMAEVEIDCDYELDYEHVIHAITAISGYISPRDNKTVVKLIEKIKFAPSRPPQN